MYDKQPSREVIAMQIFSLDKLPKEVSKGGLFVGGEVQRSTLLTPPESKFFNVAHVMFSPGARNQLHTHTTDQILFVTGGRGICATEHEEREVTVGDVIVFPAGEKHWHGATKDSYFSHVYVTGVDSVTAKAE